MLVSEGLLHVIHFLVLPARPLLTILGLQLGASLGRHEAGHEAMVVLGADAALGGNRGGDGHGGGDVGPCDDRPTGGGGRGRRGG